MALLHAKPGQAIDVQAFGADLPGSATHAILKTKSLELMRLVLRAGDGWPPHAIQGELTLLCIEGSVAVDAGEYSCELRASQLVLLPARVVHAVRALADTSLLLTVQLPAGLPGSASSTD